MCIRDRYYYICPQKSNFIISIEIASILYIPVNPYNLNSNLIVPYPVFFYGLAFCFPILLANTISTSKPQNDIIVTLIILKWALSNDFLTKIGRQSISLGNFLCNHSSSVTIGPCFSFLDIATTQIRPPFFKTRLHCSKTIGISGVSNNSKVKLIKTASK